MSQAYFVSLPKAVVTALEAHPLRLIHKSMPAFLRAMIQEWLAKNPPLILDEFERAHIEQERREQKQLFEDYGYTPAEVQTMLAEWERRWTSEVVAFREREAARLVQKPVDSGEPTKVE